MPFPIDQIKRWRQARTRSASALRWWRRLALAAAVSVGSAPAIAAPPAAGSAKAPAPELARLSYVERNVEQGTSGAWREAREGTPLRIGDRVRTAKDALLRIDFPWMAVTVSPSSSVTFPDEYVLAAVLEEGRVALQADARAILKLVTGEAAVRGQGQVVVRRQARTTLVTALAGTFFVEGAGRAVTLAAGTGTVVRAGQAPLAPLALPERPDGLDPGTDPVYVARGQPVSLRWTGKQPAYLVEVLSLGSDTVLMQLDVGAPPALLAIPWQGTFRWRVVGRDERGLEGRPSPAGLICVDK